MIETTTIRFAPASAPARWTFRAEAVKNSVAAFLVGRGPRRRIDDGLGPGERLVETLAADHVDTLGARDRDHVVSALLEDLDEVRSGPAGGSRDGNLLAPVFCLHLGPFLRRGSAPASF